MLIETDTSELTKGVGRDSKNPIFAQQMVQEFINSDMMLARVEGWPRAVLPLAKRKNLADAIKEFNAADCVIARAVHDNVYLEWIGEVE